MNIIFTIDEHVAERARQAAHAMGKSLNQAVRDYLEHLAGLGQPDAQADAFEASAHASPGRLDGWRFDRDEAHARP